ncbi:Histidine acid [Scedosporium apiospermum]|uniref:3-phytase n=1 Tax=Pseudallescheria apiosperma TaxID=563466 RepID=A0A084FVL6_PSEDA|nr:Histidine acid [Scedosporium apiospermum]KEZ39128.1 Histidine acid [Scedosporium apiospermum]
MFSLTHLVLFFPLSAAVAAGSSPRFLAPKQDIVLWRGKGSDSPLTRLGANGPWASGPNVHGISTAIPENCYVDQAAYVSRHGSRYPDNGAYNEWLEMESRFSAGGYEAKGVLSFLPAWKPVLTNPDIQIAMLGPTGNKEAVDMGYQLRTRYPQLYDDGDDFYVWANNYTRVLQTASGFVNGFLGASASKLGNVVAVTSKGIAEAIGNSLAPSDMCPNFKDQSGGDYIKTWNSIWQPRVQERLQKLIKGNLTLTLSDVNLMPYLCGFESQITGRLSPFCDVFTDDELKMYEYSNDLRYYYGVGPGTELPPKMMTPFLDSLVDLFAKGPGVEGVGLDGAQSFQVPKLLVSFLNDGQLTELVSASGVFDEQEHLSATEMDHDRLWIGSRFITMRGTIAFERLNCMVPGPKNETTTSHPSSTNTSLPAPTNTGKCGPRKSRSPFDASRGYVNATYVRIRLNDQVYPVPSCRDGPGSSCALGKYAEYVKAKYAAEGDWMENCDVTMEGKPTVVQGASFFTDLSQPHLAKYTQ